MQASDGVFQLPGGAEENPEAELAALVMDGRRRMGVDGDGGGGAHLPLAFPFSKES